MKHLKKSIFLFSALFFASSIYAQEHNSSFHGHARNEIGLSFGPIYSINHEVWGSGVHLHYFRTLSPTSRWALGGSAEYVWAGGNHFNLSVGAKYQLLDRLSISAFPGITFFSHKCTDDHHHHHHHGHDHHHGHHHHHESEKPLFTMHFEVVYDLFYWRSFHFGIAADYSLARKHSHAMLGIHVARCF